MDEIDRTEKNNDKLEKENEMLHMYENNLCVILTQQANRSTV